VEDKTLAEMEAKGNGKGKVMPLFGSYVERLMINFTDPNKETAEGERSSRDFPHPFLTDLQVRRALALAVDRPSIAALYGRTGRPTANILVSPSSYASSDTSYKFDLAEAAALLDQAGWKDSDGNGVRDKDGVELAVVYQTSINPVRQQTQDIIKKAWEALAGC
jgi:peptide/nickel transport system substrate-binding protein